MARRNSRFNWLLTSKALIAFGTAIVVTASASAQLTNGRIRQRAANAPGFTACLSKDGDKCRLIAPAVAIAIGVENGDAMISYLDPLPSGYVVQRKESVALDLENAIHAGTYGDAQAALIFAELLSMHELMYRLPADQAELKRAMGFPAQVVLSPEDQIGVLTSHLQLTLGVSAITADYLITKLGVRVVTEEKPAEPLAAPAADAATGPAKTPNPVPTTSPEVGSTIAPEVDPSGVPPHSPATEPSAEPAHAPVTLSVEPILI